MAMNIDNWLENLGLGQYAEPFRSNDVDGETLRRLNGDDLKEIGVASVGHRKKLLEAITALRAAPEASVLDAPAPPKGSAPERRQLTVMFADLVGSTALSKKLDPEEMRELIRVYQNTVAGEISRFEGYVAQFLGDGVLAYFGWPKAHEDDAERAVRAGLAVAAATARLETPAAKALQTRIGIATGVVVVGDLIGEGATQRHAVVGETPNLAARLQSVAEPGMVVIAEATQHLAGDLFVLRELGPQSLKGIAEPVPAFAVLAERLLQSRFTARHAGEVTPIVGRDQELALLVERWRQATTGEGQLVLLSGEAGIGKSRLTEAVVQSVVQAVSGEPHFLVRYQCSPYHADSALYPVIQQLTHAAGLKESDPSERRLDQVEALLATAVDDLGEVAPLVAALMGIDASARYGVPSLTPQQRRNRTLAALINQLIGLAGRKPVLWVIEDAHWIDPTTLELIELVLDRLQGLRVLALITSRPTFVAPFRSHAVVTVLALNRLSRAGTQAIVASIARGKNFPEALLDRITAATDGVPLFIEEMTKSVLESGMLNETATGWQLAAPLAHLAIPTSLHDSLTARLDRLQPVVRAVAQTAAVIGRTFDHVTLAELSSVPAAELSKALDRLVESELIIRHDWLPDARYRFKHALVRDAAYESLLKTNRQVIHLRLLGILEAKGLTAPEVLAHHAQEGGAIEKAIGYWQRAAEVAIIRAAFEEAGAHLDAARTLLPGLADIGKRHHEEAAIAVLRGQAAVVQHGHSDDRTVTLFEEACRLAEAATDPQLLYAARYGIWVGHHARDEPRLSLARAQQMLDTAVRQEDSVQSMMSYRMLGTSLAMLGQLDGARQNLERALAINDPIRHRDLAAKVGHDPAVAIRCYLALTELARGYPDRARALAKEALQLSQALQNVNVTLYARFHLGFLAALARATAEAFEHATSAIAIAKQHGMLFWESLGHYVMGQCLLENGDFAGVIEETSRAYATAKATQLGLFQPHLMSILACAIATTGSNEAIGLSEEAVALAQSRGSCFALAEIQRRQGNVLRQLHPNEIDAADRAYRSALATARQQRARLWELRAACDLARLQADQGVRGAAHGLVAEICDWFTEGLQSPDLVEARALLARRY